MAAAFQVFGAKSPPDQGVPYGELISTGQPISVGGINRDGGGVQLNAGGGVQVQTASNQDLELQVSGNSGSLSIKYEPTNNDIMSFTGDIFSSTYYRAKVSSDINLSGMTALVSIKAANADASGDSGVAISSENWVSIDYNDDGGAAATDVFVISRDGTPIISCDENGAVLVTPELNQQIALTATGTGTVSVGASDDITITATGGTVTVSTKTSGDVNLAPVGDLVLEDQYLSSSINLSESGTTALVGFTATSLVGALNEVKADVTAESLWDRAGTVLSPENSGDSLDVTIDNTENSTVATFNQNDTSNINQGVVITTGVNQTTPFALTGTALKVSSTHGTTYAPAMEIEYNSAAGFSVLLTGSGVNRGFGSFDGNCAQYAIAQSGGAPGGQVQAAVNAFALAAFGSTSTDNLRASVNARKDAGTGAGGNVVSEVQAKQLHTTNAGSCYLDFNTEQAGTGTTNIEIRANITNGSNTNDPTIWIRTTNSGTGTGKVDIDTDELTIDAGAGISIDASASSNFSTTSGSLQFSANTGSMSINAGGGRMDIDTSDELEITAGNGMDVDVTGTYDMLASGTFTIAGTGSSTVTTDTGDLQLNATSGGAVKLYSQSSGVSARLGDNAGSQKFIIRDSDDAAVATIDSNGGALFTSIALDAGNLSTDTTTGTQIATAAGQKLGFFGATPVVQPSAYTQTYATATKTHAARTAAALTDNISGSVGTTLAAVPDPADSPATADALRDDLVANTLPAIRDALSSLADQVNKGRADALDTAQVLNQAIDDLQALGLVG